MSEDKNKVPETPIEGASVQGQAPDLSGLPESSVPIIKPSGEVGNVMTPIIPPVHRLEGVGGQDNPPPLSSVNGSGIIIEGNKDVQIGDVDSAIVRARQEAIRRRKELKPAA